MKHWHVFTLFIVVVLSTISCDNKKNDNYVIGISQYSGGIWHYVVNDEMQRQAASFQNIDLDIKTTNYNTAEQIEHIEQFIADKVDLIIVSPNDGDSLNEVVSRAYNSGIPVILLNRRITSDNYTAYIGIDNQTLGGNLGKYANDDVLHSSGNVVIMKGSAQSESSEEWAEGFVNEINKHKSIHIVATAYGNFSESVAYEQMCNILDTCKSSIDMVLAMNDMMSEGVKKAIDDHPNSKAPFILGIGANGITGAEAINTGKIDAAMMYPTEGYKVIILANNILSNLPYNRENPISTVIIDKTNVDLIQIQNSQIEERTDKIDNLTSLLETKESQFIRQRVLTICILVVLCLLIFLFMKYIHLMTKRNKMNVTLQEKNEEVKSQLAKLQSQQDQMLNLSKQLEEATQAKLMFFTDITHEFKTPLTLILGPVEEMLNSGKLDKDEFESMKLIYRNGNKLMNLLNQILEFRTYENGQMEIQAEMGKLDIFLTEINNMFKPYFSNKGINFEFLTDGNDYNMSFDKDKIDKIYFNLLSNALKYVNPNGIIRVQLNQIADGDRSIANLSVFNSGSYIPDDKLQDVYKRFYHIDNEHENSGIGLALTKSLVEAHNGTISVDSVEGEGTTFSVSIPIETVQEDSVDSSNLEHTFVDKQMKLSKEFVNSLDKIDDLTEDTPEKDKKKILIIEDNTDMRRYIKLVLNLHYTVIQASNGKDGIKKAINNIPDLIITDIMMPGMDGFQVCQELKSNVITKQIPIICLTVCASDEQKIKSYDSGADAYLTKPFNANVLRIRIKKLIEKSASSTSANDTDLFLGENSKTLGDKQRAFMNKIKDYVESHIQDNISIDDLAKELGVSKSSFYRQLKEITEYNPVDIISLIKLRTGIKLMLVNHQSITEAAYATGFSSSSYFAKIFYKFYKETPSEYMKRYTKTES